VTIHDQRYASTGSKDYVQDRQSHRWEQQQHVAEEPSLQRLGKEEKNQAVPEQGNRHHPLEETMD
jgi:hypothetical protein